MSSTIPTQANLSTFKSPMSPAKTNVTTSSDESVVEVPKEEFHSSGAAPAECEAKPDKPVALRQKTIPSVDKPSLTKSPVPEGPISLLDEPSKTESAGNVQTQLPLVLHSVAESVGRHWDFMYSRVDPARETPDPNKVWNDRSRDTLAQGIDQSIARLRANGHKEGTGKVAVLGGGYEVDLKPLLELFAEVHVVDISDKPFPVVARQNADDPNRGKIKYIQTDLSGIDPMYQAVEVERLANDREAGRPIDPEGLKNFMGNMPPLKPNSLESGAYAMVVSPVLTESTPYGPLLTDVESRRDADTMSRGIDDSRDRRKTWSHVDNTLSKLPGENYYTDPRVRNTFANLFLHQSSEIDRLLEPGGEGVVSLWTRQDKRPDTQIESEPGLRRVGDNVVDERTFQKFFGPFEDGKEVASCFVYGENEKPGDDKPVVRCYTMTKL